MATAAQFSLSLRPGLFPRGFLGVVAHSALRKPPAHSFPISVRSLTPHFLFLSLKVRERRFGEGPGCSSS